MGSVRVRKGQRDLGAAWEQCQRKEVVKLRSLSKALLEGQGNGSTVTCTALPCKRASDRILRTGGEICVS